MSKKPAPAAAPGPSAPGVSASPSDVLSMSLAQLTTAVAQATAALAQIEHLLPGLLVLTADSRKHAAGRFRSGEADALLPVLDVADKLPALFEALADADEGTDPNVFEVALLRDRLQRIAALQPLRDGLEQLDQELSDTVMVLGEKTKPVMLSAYDLIKPQAKRNPSIQTIIAPTIDFYAAIAKTGAVTRAMKKQAPAAATAAVPPAPPKAGA